MAMGPICIITPSGMVCSSSKPMQRHHPKPPRPENATPLATKVYDAVDTALKGLVPDVVERELYATVAQLMAQGKVNEREAFTITATGA